MELAEFFKLAKDIVESTQKEYPKAHPYIGIGYITNKAPDSFQAIGEPEILVRFALTQARLPLSELHEDVRLAEEQLDALMLEAMVNNIGEDGQHQWTWN